MPPDDQTPGPAPRPAPPSTAIAVGEIARDDLEGLPPYRAPAEPRELRLAAIWRRVLRLDRVGLDDDFFALGGDSLAATVMFGEIERLLGRKVPTALLVRASTVATLGTALREDPRLYAGDLLVPVREAGTRPPLVLVHGHNGRILFVRRLAWLLAAEQPVYALQARGFDGATPHASVAAMVEEYAEALVQRFAGREIYLGGYCYGSILAIEVERQLRARGVMVHRLLLIDPPVFPRKILRSYSAAELEELARVHSDGLAKHLDELAEGDPEVAAWYSRDGQGYATAMAVAIALARAYSEFLPQPTERAATLIWSAQFAYGLKLTKQRWRLAAGPTENRVVSLRNRKLTHQMLLRDGMPVLGRILDKEVRDDIARRQNRGAAGNAPPAPAER